MLNLIEFIKNLQVELHQTRSAVYDCKIAMRIQERRANGDFHLSSEAFLPIWQNAKESIAQIVDRPHVNSPTDRDLAGALLNERIEGYLLGLEVFVDEWYRLEEQDEERPYGCEIQGILRDLQDRAKEKVSLYSKNEASSDSPPDSDIL